MGAESAVNGGDTTEAPPAGGKVARLLLVNDASFIENANFNSKMNRDFALNAAGYLTEQTDIMAIRPAEKVAQPLDLSPAKLTLIFAISVVLTPLLIAGLGVWVWWKRR